MQSVKEKENLALSYHKHQVDKCGKPYSGHLIRVADKSIQILSQYPELFLDSDELYLAALLHDAIEDKKVSFQEVEKVFGHTIAQCCVLLDKNRIKKSENRNYLYLKSIFDYSETNFDIAVMALIIKIADSMDNANFYRYPIEQRMTEKEKIKKRTKRYQENVEILVDYLDFLYENKPSFNYQLVNSVSF